MRHGLLVKGVRTAARRLGDSRWVQIFSPYPAACDADHSCECLEAEAGGLCTGAGSDITLASGSAEVESCGCTVWFSDSDWCDDVVADGVSHPIEWVCDPQTELYDALKANCTTQPTDAARWCCPTNFEPACLPQ